MEKIDRLNERLINLQTVKIMKEGELADIEREIEMLSKKKEILLKDICDADYKIEDTEGKIFAEECIAGKHPTVYYNDLPQRMKIDMHDIYLKLVDGVTINSEEEQDEYIALAYQEFKKKYNITKIGIGM